MGHKPLKATDKRRAANSHKSGGSKDSGTGSESGEGSMLANLFNDRKRPNGKGHRAK